jgi:drug/metabolite transporter (DMT)-like permease
MRGDLPANLCARCDCGFQAHSINKLVKKRLRNLSIGSYAVLLSAQLAVGAAAIFARYALHGAAPLIVSALRLTIAAVPLLAYSLYAHRKISLHGRHELLFALSGLALAVHFSTWIASLLYTSVAVSTLLVSTAPVWTALYDFFVRKQPISRIFWLAFLGAAAGVTLIVWAKSPGTAPISGFSMVGDLLAVAGGIAFAAYLIAIRSISHLYPTMMVVARTYSWSAFLLLIAACFAHQSPPENDSMSWSGIVAMALISQLLGHTGINASLRWFSSSTVAFSTLLEPVFAAVLAAIIFSEQLSWQTILGSFMVLGALSVILRLQPDDMARAGEVV